MSRNNRSQEQPEEEELTVRKLVNDAVKSKHPIITWLERPNCEEQVKIFEDVLLRSAKIVSSGKPQEISKIQVDVNEKIYSNNGDGSDDDESTVRIVKSSEISQGRNYEQQTTNGFKWGAGTNVGVQFGLPQVGVGLKASVDTSFKKKKETTIKESITTENKVGQESHHEESLTIPPGHKVIVNMTSYRIKYRMDYTMEYKIPRSCTIRVKYWLFYCCGLLFPVFSTISVAYILRSMPEFKEDDEYVTFTQQGSLTWFADRMEVTKTAEKRD